MTPTGTGTSTDPDKDTDTERITARAHEMFAAEMATLAEHTTASRALFDRARATMPLGVASSFQAADPYPIYLSQGRGARCGTWTAAPTSTSTTASGPWPSVTPTPRWSRPSTVRRGTGTHFAVTTEATVALAEELCRRFRLERVRFTNSGTEATMDAIRVARGVTGKDVICKIEGLVPRPP